MPLRRVEDCSMPSGDYKDLDAGISRELAARVENFWNTDRTKNGLEIANSKLRSDIETANHNADLDAQDLAYEQQGQKQKGLTSGTDAGPANAEIRPTRQT